MTEAHRRRYDGEVMEAVLLVIAAGGALFNSWQIARLAGRVDALESTMQTVLTLLAGRQLDRPAGRPPDV